MSILSRFVICVGLAASGTGEATASDWPTLAFGIEVTAVQGDWALSPDGLSVGDTLAVTLTPPEVDSAHRYASVLRDMTIVGDNLQLEAPFYDVGLNNYTLFGGNPYLLGVALACHSDTDAEGCSMGVWSEGPPYYSWTAEMLLGVAESSVGLPGSAQWPSYMLSTESWNRDGLARTFKIDVWRGRGYIDEPVFTIEAAVGEVSIAVPEPAAFAVLLTLAAATIRRRRS